MPPRRKRAHGDDAAAADEALRRLLPHIHPHFRDARFEHFYPPKHSITTIAEYIAICAKVQCVTIENLAAARAGAPLRFDIQLYGDPHPQRSAAGERIIGAVWQQPDFALLDAKMAELR